MGRRGVLAAVLAVLAWPLLAAIWARLGASWGRLASTGNLDVWAGCGKRACKGQRGRQWRANGLRLHRSNAPSIHRCAALGWAHGASPLCRRTSRACGTAK